MLQKLAESQIHIPLKSHYVLSLAALLNQGSQTAGRTLIIEVDIDISRLPLLQISHNAAPLALAFDGEGSLVVGRCRRLEAEYLDACPRLLMHYHARANNLRVVEYQQRALGQMVGQRSEATLRD